MAERPKGISQETAEAYALLGIPYEGFVEGNGYQSLMAQTLGTCYFQERGCAIPQFEPVMDSSPEMRIQSVGYKHKVKAGETLTSISQYYGATIASIMAVNPGIDWPDARNNGEVIFVGEELALPKEGGHDLFAKDAENSMSMVPPSASNVVRGMMKGASAAGGGNDEQVIYGVQVTGTLAVAAGGTFSMGEFAYKGERYGFFTYGGAFGAEGGIGAGIIQIKVPQDFNPIEDFGGKSRSNSYSFFGGGFSESSSVYFNRNELLWRADHMVTSKSLGGAYGPKAGYSHQRTKTTVWKIVEHDFPMYNRRVYPF